MQYNKTMIRCPVCTNKLIRNPKTFSCENGHSFDIAKEGYLNLYLSSSANSGDSKQSVNNRTAFLQKGYYAFLKEFLKDKMRGESLVDLGCGEGYYTSSFPVKTKIGIDLSKPALKYASKNDKSTQYILSSIFDTPLESESFDIVTTIFAPVATKEISRLLKKGGIFVLVRPDALHLKELKELLYDTPYDNEEKEIVIPELKEISKEHISSSVTIDKEDIRELFSMTPYYYHTSSKDRSRIEEVDHLQITFAFTISIYRKD